MAEHPATLSVATEQLDRLQRRAIASRDETQRARIIDAADLLISDLQAAGLLDQAAADEMAQGWVRAYAAAALRTMHAHDRLASLWSRTGIGGFISQAERRASIAAATVPQGAHANALDVENPALAAQ